MLASIALLQGGSPTVGIIINIVAFAAIFWFLLIPGPMGLVVYMLVHWSVVRERDVWQAQNPPL